MELVRQAARRGAQIICLPELFRTPYFPQHKKRDVRSLAEPIPGESTKAFGNIAAELGVVIIVPLFEKSRGARYYNSAAVINEKGKLLPTYRKLHLPHDPLFWEENYFQPGNVGYRVYKTSVATFAVLICYDQWFPEAARMATLAGAEIIFYPTAIGWHPSEKAEHGAAQLDAWRTIQRAHAIANGVYVAAINRVGHEGEAGGGIQFWGSSFVSDPFGQVVAQSSDAGPDVLVVECDLGRLETVRRHWPFLRDRRVDAYGPIVERLLEPR